MSALQVARLLGGRLHLAHGCAHGGVRRLARGVGLAHPGGHRLGGSGSLALGPHRLLGGGHQLGAAVALLEHPLGAAGGRLPQLAQRGPPHPAVGGDRRAGEALVHPLEVVDHPDARQQALGHGGGPVAGADVVEQPARTVARAARLGCRPAALARR